MADPARPADDVLCTCYAWDPVAHRHDANDHDQDCWWAKGYKSDVPCGGCWGCLSAQVAHAEVQQRLIDGSVVAPPLSDNERGSSAYSDGDIGADPQTGASS